jgi:nitrogen fixation NifU-like protein
MKIGREDVASELGGLPPIKMHCSNLAADALHEAIYDYLSKNKMTIPKELQKDHERIIRELNTVEHEHRH